MTTTPLAALQQYGASSLEPGEEYVAAIRVHAPEHDRASRDALFGVAVGSVLAYRDQRRDQRATTIPVGAAGAYLGVTDHRVLVFSTAAGMHPKELVGAVDRSGLTLDSTVQRAGLVKQARVHLLDGDRSVVDAICSAKNADLETLRSLIPAA